MLETAKFNHFVDVLQTTVRPIVDRWLWSTLGQCCQMVCIFSNQKNSILVYFWRPWDEKFHGNLEFVHIVILVYCRYGHFGILYGHFCIFVAMLIYIFTFWYIVPRKSGNPASCRSVSAPTSRASFSYVTDFNLYTFFSMWHEILDR
jgi:hypothetical protein